MSCFHSFLAKVIIVNVLTADNILLATQLEKIIWLGYTLNKTSVKVILNLKCNDFPKRRTRLPAADAVHTLDTSTRVSPNEFLYPHGFE